jgi:ribosomal protein S18 acetylase RimI-like enzyme
VVDFLVRRETAENVAAVVELIETLPPEALVVHVARGERWRRLLGNLLAGENVGFVAESEGEIVGELALTRGSGVLGLSVAEPSRREGVGTALVEAAIEWARANGLGRLESLVRPENEAGLAFLRSLGFVEEERYEDPEHGRLVALALELDRPASD